MIVSSQFGSTLRKPAFNNFAQGRSKTPNKISGSKIAQRASKSLAKKE